MDCIYYDEFTLDNGILKVVCHGYVARKEERKISLNVVFKAEEVDRRIPLKVNSIEEDGRLLFIGQSDIKLCHVFYDFITEEKDVIINIEGRIGRRNVYFKESQLSISSEKFLKPHAKTSFGYQLFKIFASFICILNLPFFLLDGLMAAKGYKELEVEEGNSANKRKMIFLHANNITKRFSGFTYSMREIKTKGFVKYYNKYRKKPIKQNQILLLSERKVEENGNLHYIRNGFKKNPKIVVEEFLNTKTINKLKISEIKDCAKKVATSSIVILEDFYPQLHFLSIREETSIIQLWHACGAFKSFGFSRLGKLGGPKEDSGNHRSYNYVMVSGTKMEPIYSEAFGIPKKNVKALGVPRTDVFFDSIYARKTRADLYEKYPILSNKKIILYAPTFRGDGNKDAYFPREMVPLDNWLEELPEDYIILLKNHPFVKDVFDYNIKWKERIIDMFDEDINNLLFVTNFLITDYSSSIFEAVLLDIPILFYVFDKKEYLKNRDIYYEFESFAPGPILEDGKEVIDTLLGLNNQINNEREEFKELFLNAIDGNSTKRIVKFIETLL